MACVFGLGALLYISLFLDLGKKVSLYERKYISSQMCLKCQIHLHMLLIMLIETILFLEGFIISNIEQNSVRIVAYETRRYDSFLSTSRDLFNIDFYTIN